jgi:hypothetical protein
MLWGRAEKLRSLMPIMSVVPPAKNVRRSNATDTMVLAPKIYTLRGAFFNKLGYSRKSSHLIGPGFIHAPESLFTTTICRSPLHGPRGQRSHLRGHMEVFYALFCI